MIVTPDFEQDPTIISNAIAGLQAMASGFSQSSPVAPSVITLQVVFVVGAANAWRLIEIERSMNACRRRMLCFDSASQIRRAIDERLAWQRADERFVANNMATPGGFPGVTADWVPSKDFDWILGPARDAIRKELCATSARLTVSLR